MKSLLSIKNLNKFYPYNNCKKEIICNFNLELYKKDFICIVGKSGCGKTTLLKLIGGFDSDYEGSIEENGIKITAPSTHRIMIFQDFNQLLPWKTVIENVLFPLKIKYKKEDINKLKHIAKKYIKMVGMDGSFSYYPHELSGGMKQRTALARALALKPDILLMDEPFSSLDAMTRSSLQQLLYEIWNKTDSTIVFVTHDIEEAIKLSTKIIIMDYPPKTVKSMIENPLDFPRIDLSDEFISLYHKTKKFLY